MKRQQALKRLEEILEQDLNDLEKTIILADGNRYLVFGRYSIEPSDYNGIWIVLKNKQEVGEFSEVRSALSWCIADKYHQYQLRENISRLEKHKLLLKADLKVRSGIKMDSDAVFAKINTRRYRLQQIDFQLDKCINLAKYWQIRGFNNETQRTWRTASYRTNRQGV